MPVREKSGGKLADLIHVEVAQRPAAGVGNVAGAGIELADLVIPQAPEFEQALLPPPVVGAPRGVLRVVAARQIETRGGPEVPLAVLAVTHAGAGPSVAEDPVHLVQGNDLLGDLGHELEIVWTEGASHPEVRVGPVPSFLAIRLHRDPVGMRIVDVLMDRVRVGARDDHHVQLAAPGHQIAECISAAEPLTAVVQRDLRRIIRHASARAEAGGIGVGALEVVQPEVEIVRARIVLHQRQLRPAHGPVEPVVRRGGG